YVYETGVKWVHELASDVGSPQLLEKANLRSDGLRKAFEKLRSLHRGSAHQAMLQRGAEIMAVHHVMHFDTSANEPQLIHPTHKVPARATNLEIISDELESGHGQNLREMFSLLHKGDFEE